jgi:hypothetical protein
MPAPRLLSPFLVVSVACALPATSFEAYRAKAVVAAEETISQAETAVLTVELADRDRLFGEIAAIELESAERAAVAATDDFAAVLPPDDRSERLRGTILPTLEDASDLIARIRFAVRHGDLDEARRLRSLLRGPLARLERWVEPFA